MGGIVVKIGIIGGIGPESTVDYYQLIIKAYRDKKNDGNYPEIIINSINMTKMLTFVSNNEWDKLVSYLSEAVKSVSDAGAQFAVIASNTPHMVFNEVQALSPIPTLSIVEETYKYAMSLGMQKVGLLGTKFTMQSDYYQKVFERNGISVVVPNSQEQDYIHNKLMSENKIVRPSLTFAFLLYNGGSSQYKEKQWSTHCSFSDTNYVVPVMPIPSK